MKTYAIILASGTAQRFDTQGARLKQFAKVSGRTLLEHVVELFEHTEGVNEIIIVITPGYREAVENLLLGGNYHKVTRILEGGATRKESSHIGIFSIPDAEAQVIIHDCARPMLSQRIIRDCLEALQQHDAVDVAIPSADTIIRVNKHGFIEEIPERSQLLRGQTPQCFKLSLIRRAHELAAEEESYTDDCGLIVRHKLASVYVVAGERANIKVTWPEDLHLADKFFQIRSMNELPEDAATLSRLRAKIVVVFGGTSGIGESIVQQAREFGSTCIPLSCRTGCDVTNPTMVRAALEEIARQHGRIDAIVNSTGLLRVGKLATRELEDIMEELRVNYLGAIHVCRAAIPYLQKTHGSLTLFTSSSYTRGRALYAPYSSAKAAIVNLAQALAEELYADGIRVNVINPARTATPMRTAAFGKEDPATLLSPTQVARTTLLTLVASFTGQVIDVRIKNATISPTCTDLQNSMDNHDKRGS